MIASWMLAPGAPFLLLIGQWELALTIVAVAAVLFALSLRFPVEDWSGAPTASTSYTTRWGCDARVRLEHPVHIDGTEHTHLEMRRPKVRDVRNAQRAGSDDAVREVALFANLCEVPPSVIEELDMSDYISLQNVYKGLLGLKEESPRRKT